MEMILNGEAEARKFSSTAFNQLVGGRYRFEPLPNQLSEKLYEAHLTGELYGAQKILDYIEKNFEADDLAGDLHIHIMQLKNKLFETCKAGEPLTGVSVFTEKYQSQQQTH